MRRLQELKNSKRLLQGHTFSGQFLSLSSSDHDLLLCLTDNDGKFTWMNLAKITTPEQL